MNSILTAKSPYLGKIKIYSDGADRNSMIEMAANPLIQGLTTNPSLMKKAGVKDYRTYSKEILSQITEKPISFEVFADDFKEMHRQALEINSWGRNVYVKIPITNSKGESAIPLIRELSQLKIKLNVTALFTLKQVVETCDALKGGAPSIASVFAGRIADTGRDPMPLMHAALEVCTSTDRNIELLWASTREAINIVQAEQCGCHIITAPADIAKKVTGFNKDLTQMSLETVQAFKSDSDSAGFSL
ncbi:MAG: transaldolase [Methylotenera sp.]|nr:transaldolase [Oligoflexia bacterium]